MSRLYSHIYNIILPYAGTQATCPAENLAAKRDTAGSNPTRTRRRKVLPCKQVPKVRVNMNIESLGEVRVETGNSSSRPNEAVSSLENDLHNQPHLEYETARQERVSPRKGRRGNEPWPRLRPRKGGGVKHESSQMLGKTR